jgi:hypothetical protein
MFEDLRGVQRSFSTTLGAATRDQTGFGFACIIAAHEKNRSGKSLTATGHDKKQIGMPFDQHQRYKIVADALDRLREDSEALEVLDVGGGEGIILNFLPGDRVTILDQTEVEGVPNFVVGDATALPFEEGSFDYVTSLDVYEHIGTGAREKYLAELRRVARRGVLLAAPFDSEEVRGAEKLANEFHRTVHLQENVWLGEHEQNGLPDLDWTRAYLERQGDEVYVLPNGYLPHWLAMISLFFYEARLEGDSRLLLDQLNSFYNEFMYEYDNSEPSYRHLVVALKEAPEKKDADLWRLASPSDHPSPSVSSTLFAAFSAALAPLSELKKLNAQLVQKDKLLLQKDKLLVQKDGQLTRKDKLLAQKDGQLTQKEVMIRDLFERLARQTTTANTVAELRRRTDALQKDKRLLEQQTSLLQTEKKYLRKQLNAIKDSRSWRMIEKQKNLRIALRNSFRNRSDEEDG